MNVSGGTPPAVSRTAASGVQHPASATDAFLQLLARAVRQLGAYAPSHAMCVQAIAACRKALVARSGTDELVVRVTGGALQVDDGRAGTTTSGDPVLLAQLQRARVAELAIGRDASARDLSIFGLELLAAADSGESLAERLTEQGITTIAVRLMPRPELLDLSVPDKVHRDLLSRERRRRDELLSTVRNAVHLYPPHKGWVRIDPAVDYSTFSLTDLAILVVDPLELAEMLARLSGEGAEPDGDGRTPLERRFRDIARIFASLEPALGRVMFGRLARVVLAMDPASRWRLLRGTVLTSLLDGDPEATILQDFPDPTLAESLCLLLDLETAAPDVLTTALDRLGLSDERRRVLERLMEAHVQSRRTDSGAAAASADLDWYARRLTKIDGASGLSFTDFAAFDLSFDDQTSAELTGLQHAIHATDAVTVRIDCLTNLVRIEPNPEVVSAFMQSLIARFTELREMARWADLALYAASLRELGSTLRERRPDVADAIAVSIIAFCTRDVAHALLVMHYSQPVRRPEAAAVIDAFGDALAGAFLVLLADLLPPAAMDALTSIMIERGATYAPALVAHLDEVCPTTTAIKIVKVLGHAGPGNEDAIAAQLATADMALALAAVRALARIGTPAAARHVAALLTDRPEWMRAAALEAMLRFAPAVVRGQVRAVLARRDLARRHPVLIRGLLERTAHTGTEGMKDILVSLSRLRFRVWNPAVARLGRRARALLAA